MRMRQVKNDFVMVYTKDWQKDPSAKIVKGATSLEKYFRQIGHTNVIATFLGSVDSGLVTTLRYRVEYDHREQMSLL